MTGNPITSVAGGGFPKSRGPAGRPFSGHNSGSRMPGIAHVHGGAIRATVGMWPRRAPAHLPPVPTAPVHRSRRPCPGPVPPLMGAPLSPEGHLLSRRRHRTGRAAPAAAHLPLSPGAARTSSGATSHMGIAFPRVATRLAFAAAAVLAVAACDDADAPSTPPAEQSAPAPAPSAPAPAPAPSEPASPSAPVSPSPTTPAQPAPDAPGDAGSGATSPGAGDTGATGSPGSGRSNLEPQSGTPSGNPAGGGT